MIGPVDSKCAKGLCQAHRVVKLSASADELRIFFNLSMDRVHYFPKRNAIYFVDSGYMPVEHTITSVLESMGASIQPQQLHLDKLGFFKGGKRILLTKEYAEPVLVALRLQGVQITTSE